MWFGPPSRVARRRARSLSCRSKRRNFRHELERFLRRLGYRLLLKELSHPAQAKAGEKQTLAMPWQNVGSAPCCKPYRVAYRLRSESGCDRTFVGPVTVNRWLPGSIRCRWA